jgi:hypothetical protein
MLKSILNQRKFQALAVAVAVAASGAVSVRAIEPESDLYVSRPSDPLVGTWRVDCGDFIAYETYTASGSLSAIDNELPSSQQTVAIGSWRRVTAHKYFEDQFQMTFDAAGVYQGTLVIHAEDELDDSGTTIKPSPYTLDFIDPANVTTRNVGSGTCTARKLPPPAGARH